MVTVRLAKASDELPEHGFELLNLDLSYVYVALQHEKVVGVLITSPMHGVLLLLRFVIVDAAPCSTAYYLLKGALKDALGKGFTALITLLEIERDTEMRLAKLVQRFGGSSFTPIKGMIVTAPLNTKFLH